VIKSGNVAEAAAGAGRRAMRRHRLRVQQPAPQPAQTRVRQWRSMSSQIHALFETHSQMQFNTACLGDLVRYGITANEGAPQ
jgi:hypothetical protein